MSKRPAKPFTVKYIPTTTQQPLPVGDYVFNNITSNKILAIMLVRLIVILVSRGFLHAAEIDFIVNGRYVRDLQYSDWTPDKEIEEGLSCDN